MKLYSQLKLKYCMFIKRNTYEVKNKYSMANASYKIGVLIIHVSILLCLILIAKVIHETFTDNI